MAVIFTTSPIIITLAQAERDSQQPKVSSPPPEVLPSPPPVAEKAKQQNNVNDTTIFTEIDEMPQFPGGDDARIKYLVENIKYPEEAKLKRRRRSNLFIKFEKAGLTAVRFFYFLTDLSVINLPFGLDKSFILEYF